MVAGLVYPPAKQMLVHITMMILETFVFYVMSVGYFWGFGRMTGKQGIRELLMGKTKREDLRT
jgi:hypothetical protein